MVQDYFFPNVKYIRLKSHDHDHRHLCWSPHKPLFSDGAEYYITMALSNEEPHIQESYTSRGFRCKICSKVIKSLDRYKEHIASHSESEFLCRKCHASFQTKEDYSKHREDKHACKCEICGRIYSSKYSLRSHMFSVHGTQLM